MARFFAIGKKAGIQMRIVRWVLMVPAAVVAWFVALFLGVALLGGLTRLCPANQMVSGMCTAPWYDGASEMAIAFGAAMAAAFSLIACTAIAPTHKRVSAIITFVGGVLVAVAMGLASGEYASLVAAVVTGAGVLWLLLRRLGESASQVAENAEISESRGNGTPGT